MIMFVPNILLVHDRSACGQHFNRSVHLFQIHSSGRRKFIVNIASIVNNDRFPRRITFKRHSCVTQKSINFIFRAMRFIAAHKIIYYCHSLFGKKNSNVFCFSNFMNILADRLRKRKIGHSMEMLSRRLNGRTY